MLYIRTTLESASLRSFTEAERVCIYGTLKKFNSKKPSVRAARKEEGKKILELRENSNSTAANSEL